jgi:hypothetical protein
MMTGVSAITAKRGERLRTMVAQRAVALMVVAAGIFALWYRQTYNVWPGQQASSRVHWCGRDYQKDGGAPQTWHQITAQERTPVHAVGQYPPLGWWGQQLFAVSLPVAQHGLGKTCAMVVYLRTGPNRYRAYSLEGGP